MFAHKPAKETAIRILLIVVVLVNALTPYLNQFTQPDTIIPDLSNP
jgi:hypothetical protein